MKMTRKDLRPSDVNTLFTRDPGTFFESILINILWNKDASSIDHDVIARQRVVFDRWFKYLEASLRRDVEAELGAVKAKGTADYQNGYLAGQIHALSKLPIHHGLFGQSVDLTKVAEELRKLKAIEPIGVKDNGFSSTN